MSRHIERDSRIAFLCHLLIVLSCPYQILVVISKQTSVANYPLCGLQLHICHPTATVTLYSSCLWFPHFMMTTISLRGSCRNSTAPPIELNKLSCTNSYLISLLILVKLRDVYWLAKCSYFSFEMHVSHIWRDRKE